ncbi:helix-turn-helix domain-containing protein [Kribbella sp. NBC_01245]|uniref:helix-turn-helix domain-containing protein n=1 Tax=Kribbella sp. NBC_01245 TaxID=2903578 RepID=UPI002E2B1C72|nr:helix-turn-helix transcriptional regulator [Kribbella sp. NBC_01245]
MTAETTGQRIARARKRRDWSQAEFAEKLGYSVSWVSQAERGKIPLDRFSVLDRVANVLGVEMIELTGQPYRHANPELDSGHNGIPAMRLSLQRALMPNFGDPARAPRPLAELRTEVITAEKLRQAADFQTLGGIMPALVDDVAAALRAADGAARDQLAELFVRVCHIARVTSDLTGHHDLAWTAVELEVRTAETLGAPAPIAAANWDLCGVWLHAGGDALRSAKAAALDSINALDPHVGRDATLTALWGAMHLRAAVVSARMLAATDVRDHLAQARRVASASGNAWQTQFNAPNVALHALETAVELGEPRDALGMADQVPIEAITSAERRTHYWTCRARGLGMAHRDDAALDALLQAERLAPAHVHNRPMARELVRDLLSRSPRRAPELRRLATRMALAT